MTLASLYYVLLFSALLVGLASFTAFRLVASTPREPSTRWSVLGLVLMSSAMCVSYVTLALQAMWGNQLTVRAFAAVLHPVHALILFVVVRLYARNFRLQRELRLREESLRKKNYDLDIAMRQAEVATRAKSTFLTHMSHELRTPLVGILGAGELLVTTTDRESSKELLGTIRGCADAMLRLVNDILDLARVEADRIDFEPRPFSPTRWLSASVDALRPAAAQKGLPLIVEIPGTMPELLVGDENRLRQVLWNLVGNAIKFTERGCVRVLARAILRDDGKWSFEVRVEDTGPGIPSENLGTIFAAFSQLDASVARRYGGSGLGLTLARQIAERMGGMISVESREGTGAAFTLQIPLAAANSLTTSAPAPSRAEETPIEGFHEVLIVEDSSVNARITQLFVEKLGAKVTIVADAPAAMELLTSRVFDLVLMDIELPGMSGLELARWVRDTLPVQSHPKILALTAYTGPEFAARCVDAGADGYLSKPFLFDELRAACLRVLHGTALTRGA